MDKPQTPETKKKRGFLLSLFLVLFLFMYTIGILMVLLGGTALTALTGALGGSGAAGLTGTLFFVGLLVMVLGFVVTIFLFKWKKWAVYTMAVFFILGLLRSLLAGPTFGQFIGQAFIPALFGFSVWKKWQFFE